MDPEISELLAAHAAAQAAAPSIDETALAVSLREPADHTAKTGILLINHGSRSGAWRKLLLDVQREIDGRLLAIPGVAQVRTAFMEYTEPSIATQLKAFDADGIERVIVVPLLLTISDHSFDDIPAICGMSDDPEVLSELADEKIEVYTPKAQLDFAPLLDFSGLVQRNTARRVNSILGRRKGSGEVSHGLVLVGYGSADFNDDWDRFFAQIRIHAQQELGITETAHAWCGHLVSYSRQPTIDAIESVLQKTDRVILLPILIAYDPMFQDKIIGRAATRCAEPHRVLYRPDSILPEPEVGRWVIEISEKMAHNPVTAGA